MEDPRTRQQNGIKRTGKGMRASWITVTVSAHGESRLVRRRCCGDCGGCGGGGKLRDGKSSHHPRGPVAARRGARHYDWRSRFGTFHAVCFSSFSQVSTTTRSCVFLFSVVFSGPGCKRRYGNGGRGRNVRRPPRVLPSRRRPVGNRQ